MYLGKNISVMNTILNYLFSSSFFFNFLNVISLRGLLKKLLMNYSLGQYLTVTLISQKVYDIQVFGLPTITQDIVFL